MAVGIGLMVLGSIGMASLAGSLPFTTPSGSLDIGTLFIGPGAWASAAAAIGVVATASIFIGLHLALRSRRLRRERARDDAINNQAERESLARLLEMRIEQLQEEVHRRENLPERLARFASVHAGGHGAESGHSADPVVVIPESSRAKPDDASV